MKGKKMKRILLQLMMIGIIFGLVGCGNITKETSSDSAQTSESSESNSSDVSEIKNGITFKLSTVKPTTSDTVTITVSAEDIAKSYTLALSTERVSGESSVTLNSFMKLSVQT